MQQIADWPAENAVLLAPLLDIPLPHERVLTLPPEELRRRQLAALTNWVMAGAKVQPVVLALEDLHWADPTTLDLLRGIAERGALAPLFVAATARPEFRPPWSMRSHHGTISLAPLDRQHVRRMVSKLAARHALPNEVVEGVTERTAGVPLFIEEVTRLLLEQVTQGGIRAIPPTLQQSLTARLDRLGLAREVAQIGAVIGRGFSYILLRTVAGMEHALLQTALERLAEADILLVQGLPPDSDYRFKHALIQDAAYENLLKSRRQALHRRTAEALHDHFAMSGSAEPELLAHHFTQAGLTEAAIEWWGKAGEQSLERSALIEAIAQFRRALAQIAALPGTPARRQEEIKLQVALITPLLHVKGYAAPETKAAVERALMLIEQAEVLGEATKDPLLLFSVLHGAWAANMMAFNGEVASEVSAQFMALAEKHGDTAPLVAGHRILGTSLLFLGEIAIDQAIALYDPAQHRSLAMRFDLDIGVTSLFYRARAHWLLGYPDIALADIDRSLREARDIGHAATLMVALGVTFLTFIHCGSYGAASSLTNELIALATEKSSALWKAFGVMIQSCLFALTGNPPHPAHMITASLATWEETGSTLYLPFWLMHLAIACSKLKRFAEASRYIAEAMTKIETTEERRCEAEVNRVAGEIAVKSSEEDVVKAEAYFQRALTVARQQQAKSWELRAAMSMARLWRDQGKREAARELLAPVYVRRDSMAARSARSSPRCRWSAFSARPWSNRIGLCMPPSYRLWLRQATWRAKTSRSSIQCLRLRAIWFGAT
jgi:predicted ATPase